MITIVFVCAFFCETNLSIICIKKYNFTNTGVFNKTLTKQLDFHIITASYLYVRKYAHSNCNVMVICVAGKQNMQLRKKQRDGIQNWIHFGQRSLSR